jgi:hypothetical protein
METKNYQGKTKQNHDAAEFMAFAGVVGLALSFLMYFIFIMLLTSCQAPEKIEPVSVEKITKSYTIHVQPNGITNYPKYLPNLK